MGIYFTLFSLGVYCYKFKYYKKGHGHVDPCGNPEVFGSLRSSATSLHAPACRAEWGARTLSRGIASRLSRGLRSQNPLGHGCLEALSESVPSDWGVETPQSVFSPRRLFKSGPGTNANARPCMNPDRLKAWKALKRGFEDSGEESLEGLTAVYYEGKHLEFFLPLGQIRLESKVRCIRSAGGRNCTDLQETKRIAGPGYDLVCFRCSCLFSNAFYTRP